MPDDQIQGIGKIDEALTMVRKEPEATGFRLFFCNMSQEGRRRVVPWGKGHAFAKKASRTESFLRIVARAESSFRSRSVFPQIAEFAPREVGPRRFDEIVDVFHHLEMMPFLVGEMPQERSG